MNRLRLALAATLVMAVAPQAPLVAQDEEVFEESSSSMEESIEEYDYDDIDGDTEDDAIDVETGDDDQADVLEFVEDDFDVSFDDADENGEADGEGVDDNDLQVFQDHLPLVRMTERNAEGDRIDGAMATDLRKVLSFAGISAGELVRRKPNAYSVRDGQASFQAEVRYSKDARGWMTPAEQRIMGSIAEWEGKHICGGALIARQWVLTAAHCATKKHFDHGLEVVLGADDISKASETFVVDGVVSHAGYDNTNIYRNDIALLHLAPDPRLARFQTISLYTANPPPSKPERFISTLGWGKTEDSNASAQLYRADVKLLSTDECQNRPGYEKYFNKVLGREIQRIDDSVICGGDTQSKACTGDSGGPVVMTDGKPMLLAVVSWTKLNTCGKPYYPGVYTRVGAFTNWIRESQKRSGSFGWIKS